MNNFFKSFFAALLALVVFSAIIMVVFIGVVAAVSSGQKAETGSDAVMVIDLSNRYYEIQPSDPFSSFGEHSAPPSLYHLTRMIRHAADNNSIKGIYLKCDVNSNEFAASEEIREALAEFRSAGKFIIAYANGYTQKSYYVASVADRIYCAPTGGVEWHGFSLTMPFFKGTLEKMEIEPQIFYAGKYKSATEPFRETQMTEANRLQSSDLLTDIYAVFLERISASRKIDTATLRMYADSNSIRFASAALQTKMVDGLKYDDEVKNEIRDRLKIDHKKKINFISPAKYGEAEDFLEPSGGGKIAVIYAEGNILDGKGDRGTIGGDTYRSHIRKARTDETVKAIVLRINSGGGSAMASEIIWRELVLAKQEKPVIVSLGDIAASGGYYIACGGDSIFAEKNTITGSIGVFGLLPNMKNFFNNKLGITFDDVKTSPDAGYLTVTKPLTPAQKVYFQNSIDTTYHVFKTRVAKGRKKSMEYIDSIAQGHIWSGSKALELGLVDKIGNLDDAIAAAAAKADLDKFRLREYPGKENFFEMIFGDKNDSKETFLRNELGREGYHAFKTIRALQQMIGTVQARMPFELTIE